MSSSAEAFRGSDIATRIVFRFSSSIGMATYFFASSSFTRARTLSSIAMVCRSTIGRPSCWWRTRQMSASVTMPARASVCPRGSLVCRWRRSASLSWSSVIRPASRRYSPTFFRFALSLATPIPRVRPTPSPCDGLIRPVQGQSPCHRPGRGESLRIVCRDAGYGRGMDGAVEILHAPGRPKSCIVHAGRVEVGRPEPLGAVSDGGPFESQLVHFGAESNRIVAVEARVAVVVRALDAGAQALHREVAERIDVEVLPNLLDRVRRRDQLATVRRVDAVVTGPPDRRTRHPEVDLL